MYNLAALEFTLNRQYKTWISCEVEQWPELTKALGDIGYSWSSGDPMGDPEYPGWLGYDMCYVECFSHTKSCMYSRYPEEEIIPCEIFMIQEEPSIDIQQFTSLI